MNLSQAYLGWQQQSQNRDLYISTREAFRKAWFTLPTNKPCSYYTKEILGEALAATREIESNKTKAASVMIHVLTFANFAEPKFNPKPDFTYHDLMEYTKGPMADPDIVKPQEKPSCLDDLDDTDLDIDPVTALPRKKMEQESVDSIRLREKMNNTEFKIRRGGFEPEPEPDDEHGEDDSRDPLAGIDFPDDPNETKPEKDMEPKEKKPRGKQPKPVMQIDPETLLVVKGWPSIGEAERGTGIRNITRAAKNQTKAGGYYWSLLEDSEEFKRILMAKVVGNPKAKTEKKPKKPAVDLRFTSKSTPILKSKEEVFDFSLHLDDETTPEPTASEKPRNAAADALKVFTDDELLAELDRRGWVGELRRVQIITIGKE